MVSVVTKMPKMNGCVFIVCSRFLSAEIRQVRCPESLKVSP